MAYNADIEAALSMATQIKTANLSATSSPTLVQATNNWGDAYTNVRAGFLSAGLSDTVTGGTFAESYARKCERFLASGYALLNKGSIGKDAKSTADDLLSEGHRCLDALNDAAGIVLALLCDGATASACPIDPRIQSWWLDCKDPSFDEDCGGADVDYAEPPCFQDGDNL
jgi:hypothetical protein